MGLFSDHIIRDLHEPWTEEIYSFRLCNERLGDFSVGDKVAFDFEGETYVASVMEKGDDFVRMKQGCLSGIFPVDCHVRGIEFIEVRHHKDYWH